MPSLNDDKIRPTNYETGQPIQITEIWWWMRLMGIRWSATPMEFVVQCWTTPHSLYIPNYYYSFIDPANILEESCWTPKLEMLHRLIYKDSMYKVNEECPTWRHRFHRCCRWHGFPSAPVIVVPMWIWKFKLLNGSSDFAQIAQIAQIAHLIVPNVMRT